MQSISRSTRTPGHSPGPAAIRGSVTWFAGSTRLLAAACLIMSMAPKASAQRPDWKPHDFQPLTELPWSGVKPEETTKVIERIFCEPNPDIRHSVLASYLEKIALDQFCVAFDAAVALEGQQEPDDLVSLMLKIWAKRAPETALKRVEQLFNVVGIEDGWLNYDSWHARDAITVQNHQAIQKSPFRVSRYALGSFAYGADASDLKGDQKRRLLESFTQKWFARFESWPMDGHRYNQERLPDLSSVFNSGHVSGTAGNLDEELGYEVAVRKRLKSNPADAEKIIEEILGKEWPAARDHRQLPPRQSRVSLEFLLLWSQLDAVGMRKWVDGNPKQLDEAWLAKCILFRQADEDTRRIWLKDIRADKKPGRLADLAVWEPEAAMEEALRTKNAVVISEVFEALAGRVAAPNAMSAGFNYLSRFDLSRLPEDALEGTLGDSATYILEDWDDVDIGGCARFGIRCLKHSPWVKWENLRRLFKGDSKFWEDGNVADRTFCALRVWAVTRPDEMKAWIATEPDKELRAALTWLLEHPWGQHPEPR